MAAGKSPLYVGNVSYGLKTTLPGVAKSDKDKNIYCLKSKFGFLHFDNDGWLESTSNQHEATHFQDGWKDGNMYIQIMSGKYNGEYVGGNSNMYIRPYLWSYCDYMKWDGNRLQSQGGKTFGHHLVYHRSDRRFCLNDKGGSDYESAPVTKIKPYYIISVDKSYATFDKSPWLKTTKNRLEATLLRDYDYKGNMCIKIESGDNCGKFLGSDWNNGIYASDWGNCDYLQWYGVRLQCKTGKFTSGHYMVYRRKKDKFYFYNDGLSDEYETECSRHYLDRNRTLLAFHDALIGGNLAEVKQLVNQLAMYDEGAFLDRVHSEWDRLLQSILGISVTETTAKIATDLWLALKSDVLAKAPKRDNVIDIDLSIIAHGSIGHDDRLFPRLHHSSRFFVRDQPQQVTMYEPWGCVVESKMVTRIAAGIADPQCRLFLVPPDDASSESPHWKIHRPSNTLPDNWNTFKNGDFGAFVPTTWLWPIDEDRPPYNQINWSEIKRHCSFNRFYFRYPLKEPLPLFIITWLLGLFNEVSQFQLGVTLKIRVHVAACLCFNSRDDAVHVDQHLNPRQYCHEMVSYFLQHGKSLWMTDFRP